MAVKEQPRSYSGKPSESAGGWKGLGGASPALHPAQMNCNADAGAGVCKDTVVPELCLGCLPPAQSRVLQPLWKPAPLMGDFLLQGLLLLHLCVLHILVCANTYPRSADYVLENILTGANRRERQLNTELFPQFLLEASASYHLYLFTKHLPLWGDQKVPTG